MPQHEGVDVEHPQLRAAIKRTLERGYSTERATEALKVPHEIIQRVERDMRREKKK